MTWRLFLASLIWAGVVAIILAQDAATAAVRLTDAGGRPVEGARVVFRYEDGAAGGECLTDHRGACEISVASPLAGLIRGYLEVEGAGRRSLLWPGGVVAVDLRLQADGGLYTPTEPDGGASLLRFPAPAPTADRIAVAPIRLTATATPSPPTDDLSSAPSPSPVRTETPTVPPPESQIAAARLVPLSLTLIVALLFCSPLALLMWLWRRKRP